MRQLTSRATRASPSSPGSATRRLLLATGGLACLLVLQALVPAGWASSLAYLLCAAGSATVVRLGIRWHRPSSPAGWRLLAAALWAMALYGVALLAGHLLPTARWPVTAAAAVDVASNVAVLGAALYFLRVRRPGHDRDALLDAATVVLAGVLLTVQARESEGPFADVVGRQLVPLVAVLLLAAGLVVGVRLSLTERWPRNFLPLLAAACFALAGNVGMFASDPLAFAPRWVQSLWLASAVLSGVAAALPDMRLLGEQEQLRTDGSVSPYRLLALSAALLTSPALALLVQGTNPRSLLLAAGLTVLTGLVLWRIARLLAERERMRASLQLEVAEREALQAQLLHQATHDGLTGLANRAHFHDRLRQALAPPQCSATVIYLDLDGFKAVNDSLGHCAGDELLRVVAARLRGCLRPGDVAGRLGGDEFAVLVDSPVQTPAIEVTERILAAIGQPVALAGVMVSAAASVGVASASPRSGGAVDGTGRCADADAKTLLGRADATLYDVKSHGKGHYRVWQPALDPASRPTRVAARTGR